MKTGRDREVDAIVAHDRAVEVANLLMGKLNRPMRRIFPEDYRRLRRRFAKRAVCPITFSTALRWTIEDYCMPGTARS